MANEFIIRNGFQSRGDSQITGSLDVTGGITGSYTGSFTGDGSGLTGVTAEWDGTHVGNAEITGSLTLTNDLIARNLEPTNDIFLNSGKTLYLDGQSIANTGIYHNQFNGKTIIYSGSAQIEMAYDAGTSSPQVAITNANLSLAGNVTASSYTGSFVGDGSGLTGISIPTGAFGIANTSGSYTYYSDFNSALTAASSGDTVEVFADVTETTATQVILKDGVNINFNGHTYTLDNIGNEHALTDNNVAVNCTLMNGIVKRINGPASNANGLTLKQDSASSKYRCYSMQFINDNGTATSHDGVLEGGYYEGGLYGVYTIFSSKTYDVTAFSQTGVGIYANGRIYNSKGHSNASYGIQGANNARMYGCLGSSTAAEGLYGLNSVMIMDCTGESSALDGIYFAGNSKGVNCSGYSTARYGIRNSNGSSGKAYNCNGYSTANYGFYNAQSSLAIQCTGVSEASAAFYTRSITTKCSAICLWNDTAGSGFYIDLTTSFNKIIDCYARVVNSAAYAVDSASGIRDAYVVNLKGEGMTTLLNIGTNLQSNTPDAYGNVLIG